MNAVSNFIVKKLYLFRCKAKQTYISCVCSVQVMYSTCSKCFTIHSEQNELIQMALIVLANKISCLCEAPLHILLSMCTLKTNFAIVIFSNRFLWRKCRVLHKTMKWHVRYKLNIAENAMCHSFTAELHCSEQTKYCHNDCKVLASYMYTV